MVELPKIPEATVVLRMVDGSELSVSMTYNEVEMLNSKLYSTNPINWVRDGERSINLSNVLYLNIYDW